MHRPEGEPTSHFEPIAEEELNRARKDWENINKLILDIDGARHFQTIRQHLDNGGNVVAFLTHQAHPDFLIALRAINHITEDRIKVVGYPASSKLYPGGELYETDGRRMLAFGETLGINYFKMVQHYNQDDSLHAAKVNMSAFKAMRKMLGENKGVYLGYFIEGGRGKGDGILQRAQEGAALLFANKPNYTEGLAVNNNLLGIPISIDNTRYLMRNKAERVFSVLFTRFPVRIGRPFFARDIVEDMNTFGHSFSDIIGARVASVVPRGLRGYYRNAEFSEIINISEMRNKQVL